MRLLVYLVMYLGILELKILKLMMAMLIISTQIWCVHFLLTMILAMFFSMRNSSF